MKIKFREVRLSKDNKQRLDLINSIIQEYQSDGYVLSLRQLYYQLVSRDVIPNKTAEYAKLSKLLTEGRMGGVVDWDAIEDRVRQPKRPSFWDNPTELLSAAGDQYRTDRMKGQKIYIECWVEKDALSGVLKRVTERYGINIMVNRGYSSSSAMFDAYERFYNAFDKGFTSVQVLYLGDFDPSGQDMIRDIDERINAFWIGDNRDNEPDYLNEHGFDFRIDPIALTWEQIQAYSPPPNPAKLTDPRSTKYVEEHGYESWEVDALPPNVLNQILTDSIDNLLDLDLFDSVKEAERKEKENLNTFIKTYKPL